MKKKLSFISFVLGMILCCMPLTFSASEATGTHETWIDKTTDSSISYVTGVVHLSGTGGVQTGYDTGKEVYSNQQKATYGNPKPAAVQYMINDAYNQANYLATNCKRNGKAGEFHMATYSSTDKDWDYRKYNTIYTVMIGNVTYTLEYENEANGVKSYKMEDGSSISDDQYYVSETHIATGDYGKITNYRVEAAGWVSGYDITVTTDGHGTASSNPAASLAEETVTLTAVPASGYQFKAWEVVSGSASLANAASASTTFTMPKSDVTVKAVFSPGGKQDTPAAAQTDIWGNKLASSQQTEKMILSLPDDNDPAGSTFSLLQASAKKVTKNSVTVTWKTVTGASSYDIYGTRCGKTNRYQKLGTVSGTNYVFSGLNKGTYYKIIVVANGGGYARAVSKPVHAATSGGKVGNHKSVKITGKKTLSLKVGKSKKIKAKAVAKSAKLKVKKHRKLAFESSDPKIATVNKSGKVTAVGAGSCIIYAYTQNGVFAKVNVKVK